MVLFSDQFCMKLCSMQNRLSNCRVNSERRIITSMVRKRQPARKQKISRNEETVCTHTGIVGECSENVSDRSFTKHWCENEFQIFLHNNNIWK